MISGRMRESGLHKTAGYDRRIPRFFTGKLLTDYSTHEFTKRNSGSVYIDRFLRCPDQANLFHFVPAEDEAVHDKLGFFSDST